MIKLNHAYQYYLQDGSHFHQMNSLLMFYDYQKKIHQNEIRKMFLGKLFCGRRSQTCYLGTLYSG